MFLLDTNCWTQIIRRREHAAEVECLLTEVPVDRLFISDYSVHGIGIIMARHGAIGHYAAALSSLSIGRDIHVVSLSVAELRRVAFACSAQGLDFDDGYQYATAELFGLKIVSFDRDFDRTPLGRLTPAAALQIFKDEPRP